MFYKIRSELPVSVETGVTFEQNNHYVTYYSNGYIDLNAMNSKFYKIRINNKNKAEGSEFFVDPVDEDTLNFCSICVELDENNNTLLFSSKILDTWTHNQYGEISNTEGCEFNETDYAIAIKANGLKNVPTFNSWMVNIMIKDGIWYTLLEEDILIPKSMTSMLNIYSCNLQKFFPSLIEAGLQCEIRVLLLDDDIQLMPRRINKSVIRIAKELLSSNVTDGSNLIMAEALLDKHDINNLCNLFKFLKMCKISQFNWELFLGLDVRLGEFNNYLIRQIFTGEMISEWGWGCPNVLDSISYEMNAFLQTFSDYERLRNPETDPLYPENLLKEHDNVSKKYTKMDDIAQFKKMVAKPEYNNLKDSFTIDNDLFEFIVPHMPEDLRKNGKVMHHCVGGYVSDVCSGRSRIIFVYKNTKEYMTIEVSQNNKIIQCKKKRNELPDDNDQIVIKHYAKKKKLIIVYY